MRWGESRNLKLVRAFLIGLPTLFVLSFFFNALDKMSRAHGGSGFPGLGAWIWLTWGAVVAVAWLAPVPRPEALTRPWRGGPRDAWVRRIVRGVLLAALFLALFGAFWEVANAVTLRDLNEGSEDWWVARSLFAGLYALASLLFVVEPSEVLTGDLRPWGPAERAAARRLAVSFLLGWALVTVPAVATLMSFPGTDVALAVANAAVFGIFFGFFFGLIIFATWGLLRSRFPVRHAPG